MWKRKASKIKTVEKLNIESLNWLKGYLNSIFTQSMAFTRFAREAKRGEKVKPITIFPQSQDIKI